MSAPAGTIHVVVMGVSGCGKSTVARGMAERMALEFGEADEFHPPANIEKMSSGVPLTDEDRWPWLRDLAAWTSERAREGVSTVVACSALKRSYRDVLRDGPRRVFFVHLYGDAELISARLKSRAGHFMPPSLLQSQYDTLEQLEDDEEGVTLDIDATPDELTDQAVDATRRWAGGEA